CSRTYPTPPQPYPPSLHDALPIWVEYEEGKFDMAVLERALAQTVRVNIDEVMGSVVTLNDVPTVQIPATQDIIIDIRRPDEEERSEEHTSELQSRENLVCRLLLEK